MIYFLFALKPEWRKFSPYFASRHYAYLIKTTKFIFYHLFFKDIMFLEVASWDSNVKTILKEYLASVTTFVNVFIFALQTYLLLYF